ncbi:MAG: protease modulator HflC [Sinobacterium sp.]|nr:protease modulator HflC [Sinobacterium sp.]
MQAKSMAALMVVFILLMGASSTLYVIHETDRAVLLKFGEVINPDVKPGLHFKVPVMHVVRKFDGRILTLDARPERYLTIEKKSLIIDSFAKWRVSDVNKYYKKTGGEEMRTQALLSQLINEGLRNEVGERDMHEVVSGKRDELMVSLTQKINKIAMAEYGVEVVDIRVKKVDLPNDVRQSVFDRMNTERQREAKEHRSQGLELAEGIRAAADREQVVIKADAYRKSELLRGEGEAVAAATYAKAYQKNAEFYAFWRSMRAYEETFANKSDLMLLKPDSDFFKYLNQSSVKK